MGCLASLAVIVAVTIAPPAYADPPAGGDDRLEGCEGLPARDRLARVEPVGSDALHAVTRSSERFLVFPSGDGRGCDVYPIGRADARAHGKFGKGGKVFALVRPQCAGGGCTVALAVRGSPERPLAALRTEADCSEGVALRTIKLFPGRDSIELTCRTSAGAGWKERRLIVDVSADIFSVLYQLDTGSYIAVSPDEKKAGACPSRPVGSIRVEKVAARPLLRVVDPASGELQDGKGTLPARQLAFDPAQRMFAPTGAPDIATRVDARPRCR